MLIFQRFSSQMETGLAVENQHAVPVFDLHFSKAFALIAVWSLPTGVPLLSLSRFSN